MKISVFADINSVRHRSSRYSEDFMIRYDSRSSSSVAIKRKCAALAKAHLILIFSLKGTGIPQFLHEFV